ncbi:hypothetical protein Tco_0612743 [Tanacetum coccineum]
MKEKGDQCLLVGYSTQSKGYRVYNKRTQLIVESIRFRFDEIKEMSETFVDNNTSGLAPQRQKASEDYHGEHNSSRLVDRLYPFLVLCRNQHDDVPVVLEPVLVDKDEDPEEEEFEEEEEPQEEEDDMEVDIQEDENEPELTYPYERGGSCESSTTPFLQEDSDGLLPGLMRGDINSLFGWMASLSRRLCGRETAQALVEKRGKTKDKYYGKLILDLGNEVRSSVEQGTTAMEKLVEKLDMTRVKRDLYWTRVRAHEFYQEMIRRGFVFEERPNEAIDVLVEDVESSSPKASWVKSS